MKILESIDDASNIETSSGVIKPAWGKRNVDVSMIKFHQILLISAFHGLMAE